MGCARCGGREGRQKKKRERGEREGYFNHRHCKCTFLASFVSRQRLFHTSGPDDMFFQPMEAWMGWRLDLCIPDY